MQQRDAGARTGAQCQRGQIARSPHDCRDVFHHAFAHCHALHRAATRFQTRGVGHSLQTGVGQCVRIEAAVNARQQCTFLFLIRIIHQHFQRKTVELRFGQRIRAFVINRVLRGENGKHRRQNVRLAVDRRAAFLHCFQKRGLRLGRRSVDFVGEQHIGENRAATQTELRCTTVENIGAHDIGGHQIGRELHAFEGRTQNVRH